MIFFYHRFSALLSLLIALLKDTPYHHNNQLIVLFKVFNTYLVLPLLSSYFYNLVLVITFHKLYHILCIYFLYIIISAQCLESEADLGSSIPHIRSVCKMITYGSIYTVDSLCNDTRKHQNKVLYRRIQLAFAFNCISDFLFIEKFLL